VVWVGIDEGSRPAITLRRLSGWQALWSAKVANDPVPYVKPPFGSRALSFAAARAGVRCGGRSTCLSARCIEGVRLAVLRTAARTSCRARRMSAGMTECSV